MICKNCGFDNAEGAKFCISCGTRLAEEEIPARTEIAEAVGGEETEREKMLEKVLRRSWIFTLLFCGILLYLNVDIEKNIERIFELMRETLIYGLVIGCVLVAILRFQHKIQKIVWHEIDWYKFFQMVLLLAWIALETGLFVALFTVSLDILPATITFSRFYSWYWLICLGMGCWAMSLHGTISPLKASIVSFCLSPILAGLLLYKKGKWKQKERIWDEYLISIFQKSGSGRQEEPPVTASRRNWTVGVGVGILVFVLWSTFGSPSVVRSGIENGDAYLAQGVPYAAIGEYSKAIEADPRNAKAYRKRGDAYYRGGKYDKAIVDYDNSIKYGSPDLTVYFHRGNAYERKHEHDKAIADYSKVIEMDPQHIGARYGRADAYRYAHADKLSSHSPKALMGALADYTFIINSEQATDKSAAYAGRGAIYYEQKDIANAMENYTKAIELSLMESVEKNSEELVLWYKARSDCYVAQGNLEAAIADLSNAVECSILDRSELYKARADLYRRLGNTKQAEADMAEAEGKQTFLSK